MPVNGLHDIVEGVQRMTNVRRREFSGAQFVVRPSSLLAEVREVGGRLLQLLGRQVVRDDSGDPRERLPHALGVAEGMEIMEIDRRSPWWDLSDGSLAGGRG
jgi:hypothetical protein